VSISPRCLACDKHMTQENTAAIDLDGDAYCFDCWDNPDGKAVELYNASGGYNLGNGKAWGFKVIKANINGVKYGS